MIQMRQNEVEVTLIEFEESVNALLSPLFPTTQVKAKAEELLSLFKSGIDVDSYFGTQSEMTNDDWLAYVYFLKKLDGRGALKYGTEYEYTTSTAARNGILYLDCWGLIKLGSRLFLTKESMSRLSFRKVNDMYEEFVGNSNAVVGTFQGPNIDDYDVLPSGTVVFIDNVDTEIRVNEKTGELETLYEGYDHVYVYVKNFEIDALNEMGDKIVIDHALIGIGAPGERNGTLQIVDLREMTSNDQKRSKMAWGYQK